MKHRLAVLLLVGLAFSAMLQGAGTVTQTRRSVGNDTNIVVLTIDWTADAADGSVPFTYLDRDAFRDGYSILQVQTKPGGTAPTANYDIVFADERGGDLMAAACLNRSASATEYCTTDPHPVFGSVQLQLTNNSVNSATGTAIVTLTRNTVAKRGGTASGEAVVANDTYACAGSGNNTISHNKDTLNVIVAAYDGSNVQTDWNTLTITDANTVTVNFTTAVTSRRCVVNSSGGGSGGGGGDELQANKNQANGYMGLDGTARASKTNQHNQTVYADQTVTWSSRTGHLNMALGALRLPSGAALPGTCSTGEVFMDTDATSGQRIYGCESTNTWVLEGDGGGGGSGDVTDVLAGTGIAVANGAGPQPSVSVSLNGGAAQTCTGTDKVSALSTAGIVTCTADSGGGGTGDLTEVQAGNGISITSGTGPIPVIAVSAAVLQGTLYTITVDIPSVAAATCWKSSAQTASGVGILDAVTSAIPYNGFNDGLMLEWRIEEADNLRLKVCNPTVGAIDPASGNFRAAVLKVF